MVCLEVVFVLYSQLEPMIGRHILRVEREHGNVCTQRTLILVAHALLCQEAKGCLWFSLTRSKLLLKVLIRDTGLQDNKVELGRIKKVH